MQSMSSLLLLCKEKCTALHLCVNKYYFLQGNLLVMLIISATDKQWSKSEGKLRKMISTFRA